MLTSAAESHIQPWHLVPWPSVDIHISNLCDTKYYIDNGNMCYKLATADSVIVIWE